MAEYLSCLIYMTTVSVSSAATGCCKRHLYGENIKKSTKEEKKKERKKRRRSPLSCWHDIVR